MRTRRLVLSALAAAPLALGVLVALPAPAPAADTDIQINEFDSNGGFPDDWVELVNNGATPVPIGNWTVRDQGNNNNATIPAGTVLAPGALYTVDMGGLGDGDTVRVLASDNTTVIDSHVYPLHATNGTWSACPDGGNAFVDGPGSKGLPNACTPATPWPGGAAVTVADTPNAFGGANMSGLAYEGSGGATPGTMWAVKNNPGTLYKVTRTGGVWGVDADWSLNYLGAGGNPDAEGVTLTDAGAAGGIYVAVERDGSGASKPEILRYAQPAGAGGAILATHEWNLSADLPGLDANGGPEAIAWVPDSYLVAKGFKKVGGATYDPAGFPNHGSGLFFVGVEQTGQVIGYALNHANNTFTRVATVNKVMSTVTDLVYDPELQKLWVECDDNCGGRTTLLDVDTAAGPTQGTWVATATYERPTGMLNNPNNEGFTIASRTECAGGSKPVFWADDANTGGTTLRAGTLPCTASTGPTITGAASSSKPKTASGWYGAAVTVTFTCTPGSSPISGGCPAPVALTTSGANQSVSRTIHNADFAVASTTVSDIDIDLVAPTAKITGVKKGKTYAGKKKPKCKASDALSGLASCQVKQKKKGTKYKVTATATDHAGNVTVVTLTYKVKKKN